MPSTSHGQSNEASTNLSPEETCNPESLRPDALPGPAFQRGILRALVDNPAVEARSLGPFRIQVETRDEAYQVRLDEQFKRYRHRELELEDAIEEIKAALKLPGSAIEAAGPFPRLARPESLDPATYREPCPFDPELVVFFVRELPTSHMPLTAGEVRSGWSGAPERLFPDALANLGERTETVSATSQGQGDELTIGFASGDGFDAARLLLPSLCEALDAWLPGRSLVAIPSRDLLMAIGDSDPDFVAAARAHVQATFESAGEHALSPRWYQITPEGSLTPLDS
jgi:hypothetical protein